MRDSDTGIVGRLAMVIRDARQEGDVWNVDKVL